MRLKFDETRAVREAAVLNAPPEPPDQQRDASAGAPAALPVLPPLTALAEIVVLFALIYGLDQLTPNLSILDLSPHPFWIPVLLVSLLAIPVFVKRHSLEAALALLVSTSYILLYGRWFFWHAGYAWGPRFLVPIVPFAISIPPPST